MAQFIYRLVLSLYYLLIRLTSVFNTKSRKFIRGRKDIFKTLGTIPSGDTPLIWFHCASLGEFEQARPILEACRSELDCRTLVTFYSPSGYDTIHKKEVADKVAYLPLDSKSNAQRFIEIVQPDVALFIRYEFWYFYLSALKIAGIPILSVSSDFREDQFYFKWYAGIYLTALKGIRHFFVQDKASERLLAEKDITQVTVSGDTRFDRVRQIASQQDEIPYIDSFRKDNKLMVIGSAWPEDMKMLYPLTQAMPEMRFVIAPHELNPSFYKEIENNITGEVIYFSQLKESASSGQSRVMIMDTIGLLSRLYRYANYSYVGGAMGPGVHNVLEPAVWGIPVFYGNRNYRRWQEAASLERAGGGFPVGSFDEIHERMKEMELDTGQYKRACQASADFVSEHAGATTIVMNYLKKLLE